MKALDEGDMKTVILNRKKNIWNF
ncbi:hypothetical protein P5772_08195 [Bacillus cereus]|nr:MULTISPECIES: hypothetical protein [Bacillus cereus group]MDF9492528.1 hypothetical protein [Bacillus cereus]MEB9737220.1 hypothetical protein [Bacillus cereus]WBO75570.1 hypothetical protein GVV68_14495 [Bacillus cereus]